jgi:DNA-binding NtrC family response regulator
LENAIKRFLILPDLRRALTELQEPGSAYASPSVARASVTSLKELSADAAEKAEKELVFRTLNDVNWNRKQAAQRLKISYKSLLNKLHRAVGPSTGGFCDHGKWKLSCTFRHRTSERKLFRTNAASFFHL